MTVRWAIAGGGTGGHVSPALALGEVIRRQGDPVRFFGTRRGLEARLVPEAGFELTTLDARPWVGRGPVEQARALWALGRATRAARVALREARSDVVLAVGGYASIPPALAARSLGLPLVVVNPDSSPGLANRLLARFAARVFVGFESAVAPLSRRPGDPRVRLTGVPLREGLLRAFAEAGADAAPAAVAAGAAVATVADGRDGGADRPLRLLVFGGSQGARQLNEAAIAIAPRLAAAGFRVVHQTGESDRERVAAAYRAAGVPAEVVAFERDMPARYREADLVLCRAGAITVAELALAGRPAVLVPLAHVGGGEQLGNARELERAGAARVLDARTLVPEDVAAALEALAADRAGLRAMGRRAASRARPDAAEAVVAGTRALLGGRPARDADAGGTAGRRATRAASGPAPCGSTGPPGRGTS